MYIKGDLGAETLLLKSNYHKETVGVGTVLPERAIKVPKVTEKGVLLGVKGVISGPRGVFSGFSSAPGVAENRDFMPYGRAETAVLGHFRGRVWRECNCFKEDFGQNPPGMGQKSMEKWCFRVLSGGSVVGFELFPGGELARPAGKGS